MIKSKKGQSIGLIGGIIFGVASLIIGVIIAFVVVTTLTDADLLTGGRDTSTVVNESTASGINDTGTALSEITIWTQSYAITELWNVTTAATPVLVPAANYTVSSAGIVKNATTVVYPDVNISYTYTTQTVEEQSADGLSSNFSEGVDEVADKIPTVLLIAAIVLILGILALLVGVWQRMSLGAGI